MKRQIINQIITLFIASLAFITALAWNEAVQSIFHNLRFNEDKRIMAQFIYAIMMTIITVIISTVFAKLIKED